MVSKIKGIAGEQLVEILEEIAPTIIIDIILNAVNNGEFIIPKKSYDKADMLMEKEEAKVVGLAAKTLRNYRYNPTMGNEIPFHRVGLNRVRYQYSDLINYKNSKKSQSVGSGALQ